ncbi:MAG: hypothetical protein HY673_00590 [Chloroflexi bacterium]|nr:hypothetical protein [Chloroflexota bacterium]
MASSSRQYSRPAEHREGKFKGLKGLSLYYQCWLPAGDPRAILVVVHGLAEHSPW